MGASGGLGDGVRISGATSARPDKRCRRQGAGAGTGDGDDRETLRGQAARAGLILVTAHLFIMVHQKHTQMPALRNTEKNVVGQPFFPYLLLKGQAWFFFIFGVPARLVPGPPGRRAAHHASLEDQLPRAYAHPQRRDRGLLEHGMETGVVWQLPDSGFIEEHRPLTSEEHAPLRARNVPALVPASGSRAGEGVPAPRTRGPAGRARAIASRAFAETVASQPNGHGNGQDSGHAGG